MTWKTGREVVLEQSEWQGNWVQTVRLPSGEEIVRHVPQRSSQVPRTEMDREKPSLPVKNDRAAEPQASAGSASAWRVCWVSLNTSRTELFEDHDKATAKARETGGCLIPLYTVEPQPTPVTPEPVNISIKRMALSDGSADYYVALTIGKREITPYKFKEEWQAQYEADSFRWLFLGATKPDLLAYGPTSSMTRPNRAPETSR